MAKVIKDTPEEPIAYLIKVLKKMYSEGGAKVCIVYLPNNIIIIPLACVGYEMIDSQRGT